DGRSRADFAAVGLRRLPRSRNCEVRPRPSGRLLASRLQSNREGMTTPRRLSPLDASFLYYEKPHQRLHVGCVALLDGSLPFEPSLSAIGERLGSIRRYRQRPVRPLLDLEWPHWEDDPDFDVRRHVRHVAVPAPGDDAALHQLVDTLFAMPL